MTYGVAADEAAATDTNSASASAPSRRPAVRHGQRPDITSDASLSLVKTFTDASVTAGTTGHTFTILVTNTGAFSTTHNVVVSDAVDGRLAVSGETATGAGDCTASVGQSISCSFASLAAGASETVTVTYGVSADEAAATVTNSASASSLEVPATASNTASVDITSDASLSLVKTFTDASVTAGTTGHTFTILVTNTGAFSTTHNVVVSDAVDGRLAVSGETATGAGELHRLGRPVDQLLVREPRGGRLRDGHRDLRRVGRRGRRDGHQQRQRDSLEVPATASNTASVDITSDASLSLVKTFTDASVTAGTTGHTFTILVTNTGAFSTTHNVVVSDAVDGRLAVAARPRRAPATAPPRSASRSAARSRASRRAPPRRSP